MDDEPYQRSARTGSRICWGFGEGLGTKPPALKSSVAASCRARKAPGWATFPVEVLCQHANLSTARRLTEKRRQAHNFRPDEICRAKGAPVFQNRPFKNNNSPERDAVIRACAGGRGSAARLPVGHTRRTISLARLDCLDRADPDPTNKNPASRGETPTPGS
jgi:hypothetical protein